MRDERGAASAAARPTTESFVTFTCLRSAKKLLRLDVRPTRAGIVTARHPRSLRADQTSVPDSTPPAKLSSPLDEARR
jgi:hypothetical protein